MDPGTRAQAEALLKSGRMAPEDAKALRAALQAADQESGAPDPNEARAQRLDNAQREFDQETSPGALAGGVANTAWEKLKAMGRGAVKLGDVMNPFGAMGRRAIMGQPGKENVQQAGELLDPERGGAARRELGRGLSDTMLGLPVKITDLAQRPAVSTPPVGPPWQPPGPYEANEAEDPAAAPDYRTAGQIAGTVAPGSATNMIGRTSFAVANRLGLSPATTALLTSQLASGANAAANTAAGGGSALDSGTDALEAAGDPLNLIAPVAMTVAQKTGQGGKAVARALRDDTSAMGGGADTLKTLDEMRDRGAITGNLRRTVRDPELAKLPRGKKGYVKAAQNARDTIGENTAGDLKRARADYAKGLDEVLSEHTDAPYSMEGPQGRIDKLRAENTVNGEAIDDALGAALDKAQKMITVKSPESAGNSLVANASARESTVGDMLKVKRAMDAKAEWGAPATPENRPYRLIAREFAQQAEGIDPRIKALNAKYKGSMDKLEESNDILYGADAPEVADRPALRRRAAGKLMRTGDDTTSGELGEEDIDRLGELDQRNAKPIRTLREKKAIERTRFGMPSMSKSPEKWMTSMAEQNLDATRARVVDPIARLLGSMGIDPVIQAIVRARLAAQQQGDTK